MGACASCGDGAARVYSCEHTGGLEYCRICYEDLHYHMTEQ